MDIVVVLDEKLRESIQKFVEIIETIHSDEAKEDKDAELSPEKRRTFAKLICTENHFKGAVCDCVDKKVPNTLWHAIEQLHQLISCQHKQNPFGKNMHKDFLCGVNITKCLSSLAETKHVLLEEARTVEYLYPQKAHIYDVQEFESEMTFRAFCEILPNFGFASAVKFSPLLGNLSSPGGFKQNNENWYSRVYVNVIPIALTKMLSPVFEGKLQKTAFNELKNIETAVINNKIGEAEFEARNFFNKYGSHIFFGDIHLGGIHMIRAIYKGKITNRISVKNMVQSILSLYINNNLHNRLLKRGSTSKCVSGEKVLEILKEKHIYDTSEIKKISIEEYRFGGMVDMDSLAVWKIGLNLNIASLVVVDRTFCDFNDLTGIWSLVENKTNPFRLGKQMSMLLCETWEKLTGLRSRQNEENTEIILKQAEIVAFMRTIQVTNQTTPSPAIIISILRDILKKLKCPNTGIWKTEIESSNEICELFTMVPDTNCNDDEDLQMFELLSNLLSEISIETKVWKTLCDIIAKRTGKSDLSAMPIRNFTDLLKGAKVHFLDQLEEMKKYKPSSDIETFFIDEFGKGVYRLLAALREMEKNAQVIFVLGLLIPYGYRAQEKRFLCRIPIRDIKNFLQELTYKVNEYEQTNADLDCELRAIKHLIENFGNTKDENWRTIGVCKQVKLYFDLEDQISSLGLHDSVIHRLMKDESIIRLDSLERATNCKLNGPFDERISISWTAMEKIPKEAFRCIVTEPIAKNAGEEKKSCMTHSSGLHDILVFLGLESYFPEKLKPSDVLKISNEIDEFAKDGIGISMAILKGIIFSDQDFRDLTLYNFSKILLKENEVVKRLHPSDVHLAIFMCCDPFLKKIIAEKIAMMQYALPFIFKDFCSGNLLISHWPLREVHNRLSHEVTKTFKTVTFIRMGKEPLRSKSQLINNFFRTQNEGHNTFFHHDCPLGSRKRNIANGLVEISWYIPDSMDDDHPLTVLNLRGNATEFIKQIDIVLVLSDIIVVLVKSKYLNDKENKAMLANIYNCKSKILIVTEIDEDIDDTWQKHKDLMCLSKKHVELFSTIDMDTKEKFNLFDLIQNFRTQLKMILKEIPSPVIWEKALNTSTEGVVIDENQKKCAEGRELAEKIVRKIDSKESTIPLQGKEWHEWSKLLKEGNRKLKSSQKAAQQIQNSMKDQRKKQVAKCSEAAPCISDFVEFLAFITRDEDTTNFFLHWLRLRMDERTRNELPLLRKNLLDAFKENQIQKTHESTKKVEEAERKLENASFGMEHFFRELSQIYESFVFAEKDTEIADKTNAIIHFLPRLFAKIVSFGHPMEIMDGNAGNVPLTWLEAVFQELDIIFEHGRVLPISVLGIQSTGKSTLLNTMFGLHFPVSAGRCTRGIYAQFVAVKKDENKNLFDYAMILDTEGLRAPELAGEYLFHDNELSTFVIGLGDVVMINIKGEAIADVENILQIVVHAFLRLKQANRNIDLRQSAIFVHQNVSATNIDKKTFQGTKNTVQSLDKMTQEVALQEHAFNVKSFKDIIYFDPLHHIKYIPELFRGTPPMAPVNPSYSKCVKDVAHCLFEEVSRKNRKCLSLSNIFLHVQSLWKAILTEDFVFSFRNALEVKAYRILDEEYQKLAWELEGLKLDWSINNVGPKLGMCKGESSIERCASLLETEFLKNLSEKQQEVTYKLRHFSETSELKEQMVNWIEQKCIALDHTVNHLLTDFRSKIEQEVKKCKNSIKTNDELLKQETEINKKAVELAETLRGYTPGEKRINESFETHWMEWIKKFDNRSSFKESHENAENLAITMKGHVCKKFPTLKHLLLSELDRNCLNLDWNLQMLKGSFTEAMVEKEDIIKLYPQKTKHVFQKIGKWFVLRKRKDTRKIVVEHINHIFSDIDDIIQNQLKRDSLYEEQQFTQILKYVKDNLEGFRNIVEGIIFTNTFEVKVILHVTRHAFIKFKKMNDEYNKRHSMFTRLLHYKPRAMQIFKDTFQSKNEEIIASNIVCGELKELIVEKIERGLPIYIQRNVTVLFGHSKHTLMSNVLEELARKGNFNEFASYIRCHKGFVLKWLTINIDKKFFSNHSKGKKLSVCADYMMKELKTLIEKIEECVNATEVETDVQKWIKVFCSKLGEEKLAILSTSFQHVKGYQIKNSRDFCKYIRTRLAEIQHELTKDFENVKPNRIRMEGQSLYEEILDKLWGCTEECPWCHEPCHKGANHALGNDNHTCIQHRPQGVGGVRQIKDDILVNETCNFLVQSSKQIRCGKWCGCIHTSDDIPNHPYKEYKKYIPNWDIPPLTMMDSTKYWNWFMCQYKQELANYYNADLPEIPSSWEMIRKEDAIRSLYISEN